MSWHGKIRANFRKLQRRRYFVVDSELTSFYPNRFSFNFHFPKQSQFAENKEKQWETLSCMLQLNPTHTRDKWHVFFARCYFKNEFQTPCFTISSLVFQTPVIFSLTRTWNKSRGNLQYEEHPSARLHSFPFQLSASLHVNKSRLNQTETLNKKLQSWDQSHPTDTVHEFESRLVAHSQMEGEPLYLSLR